ncbi:MAG: DUF4251 domain-containing protein [Bacteroidales bacterium]
MRTYIFVLLSLLLLNTSFIFSQDQTKSEAKAAKKEAKAKAKQERAAYDKMLYEKAVEALDSSEFVLEADMIYLKRGDSFPVSSIINFISVNGDKAVVQIASNSAMGGPNQIGGVTVEGYVRNLEITRDRKGIVKLQMDVSGIAITAKVEIMLYGNSNKAEATIYPTFNSRRMTMIGQLTPLKESNIYKSGFSY